MADLGRGGEGSKIAGQARPTSRTAAGRYRQFNRLMAVLPLGFLRLVAPPAAAQSPDEVLYRYSDTPFALGKFGAFARFQSSLFAKATECNGSGGYGGADGQFGPATRRAIEDLLRCYPYGPQLAGSLAGDGRVTRKLWELLLGPGTVPDYAQRANELVLVLEATDYDRLEFNFCQSRNPKTQKTYLQGDPECFSNDRTSYITWGPRGATAGHGAEVQQVLWNAESRDPGLLDRAFGNEAAAMRRLIVADDKSRELILCSIWLDPQRRGRLKAGFAAYGAAPAVQDAYQRIYDSTDADGAKMQRFFRLYATLGRTPTEVDYAFFLDRSTHGGVLPHDSGPVLALLRAFLQTGPKTPGQLRWRLAERLPVTNQIDDRHGRDVIFVRDDPAVPLTERDRKLWKDRAGFSASDFGLSDGRNATFVATPASGFADVPKLSNATSAERTGCPTKVLSPRDPSA